MDNFQSSDSVPSGIDGRYIPLVDHPRLHSKPRYDSTGVTNTAKDLPSSSASENSSKRHRHTSTPNIRQRKGLVHRRKVIVDAEFVLALVGIILMMIETELYVHKYTKKHDSLSVVLRLCISLSTVGLLLAVLAYHVTRVRLLMLDNNWKDWRLALQFPAGYVIIVLELVVCAIHPLPWSISYQMPDIDGHEVKSSLDAILSILMFARLYLLGNFFVVHHHIFTDTSAFNLRAFKHVEINSIFVFKSLMTTMPGTVLLLIVLGIILVNTWSLRTCEVYYHKGIGERELFDSLWLAIVTFLTVGYGDVVPNTYCGRFVCVVTAMVGVGVTALLVAVLAQKLEQSKPERTVHNFVSRMHLEKMRKNAASNVIKFSLCLWRLKRTGVASGIQRTRMHRKLLQAVNTMKYANNEKVVIEENSVGIVEVGRTIKDVQVTAGQLKQDNENINMRITILEQKLDKITETVTKLLKKQ